ncbi:MAG: hypothetical protein ACREQM_19195 [Candidatus Dormibacteraceae bacterium]
MTTKKVEIHSLEDFRGGFLARGDEVAAEGRVARVSFAVAPSFAQKLRGCVDRGERVSGQVDDSRFLSREAY